MTSAAENPPTETVLDANWNAPDTYRGWQIEQAWDNTWEGTGPNFDASYEGPEDGWVGNGQCVQGCKTWDDLREEIDAYIEEHGE